MFNFNSSEHLTAAATVVCVVVAIKIGSMLFGRADNKRNVKAGRFGPRITEGLISEQEIVDDYDTRLTALWGGPPPKHFQLAFDTWTEQYGSGKGKVALVTGGGAGIGFYVSKLLVRMGYKVIIPFRTGLEHEANGAKRAIAKAVSDADVLVPTVPLDLNSFESVRAFAKGLKSQGVRLDLLCLNAGRGGSNGDPHETTADGVETIVQVNALAHFLLTAECLPIIADGARIVSQSSGARKLWADDSDVPRRVAEDLNADESRSRGKYDAFSQYCLSKAANCFFTIGLNTRLGLRAMALATDPGFSSTGVNIQHNLGHSHLKMPDGVLPTAALHDVAGHHAADGALNMALACVDPEARPNDFYSPAKDQIGPPRRNTQASLAAAKGCRKDPMYEGAAAWPDRTATVEAFWSASCKATGVPPAVWQI